MALVAVTMAVLISQPRPSTLVRFTKPKPRRSAQPTATLSLGRFRSILWLKLEAIAYRDKLTFTTSVISHCASGSVKAKATTVSVMERKAAQTLGGIT